MQIYKPLKKVNCSDISFLPFFLSSEYNLFPRKIILNALIENIFKESNDRIWQIAKVLGLPNLRCSCNF